MRHWILLILLLGLLGYGLISFYDLIQGLKPTQMNTLVLLPMLVEPVAIIGGSCYFLYKNFFRGQPQQS